MSIYAFLFLSIKIIFFRILIFQEPVIVIQTVLQAVGLGHIGIVMLQHVYSVNQDISKFTYLLLLYDCLLVFVCLFDFCYQSTYRTHSLVMEGPD